MNEVRLLEILDAREARAALRHSLLGEFHKPLICLTLNIPGPCKVFDPIPEFFLFACGRIEELLSENGVSVIKKDTVKRVAGYEAFYCVDGEAALIKKQMICLEDRDALGRLLDIDVFRTDGSKVSRQDLGHSPRTCLLCRETAHNCSRSRRHRAVDLLSHIRVLLQVFNREG